MIDTTNKFNRDEPIGNRISISDAYDDLNEFNEVKRTVADLLKYRRSLMDIENSDFDKINEIKGKALDAINNLFNDIHPKSE